MSRSAAAAGTEALHPPFPPPLVLAVSVLAISWAAPLVRFSEAPALAISFWRLAFSVVLIAGVLTVRGEWGALRRLSARELGTAAVAGVFLAGHFATWIASIGLTSVAASVALVSTAPVFVALLSALFLRERPSSRQWMGIVVAVVGAGWIGWGDAAAGPAPLLGDLLAVAGAVLVAGYYTLGRKLRARVELWPFVGVVYGCAALTLLLVLPAAGVPFVGYAPTDWAVFAGLAVGPMLIGHTGQNWALRYLPAYLVNLSLLAEPVGATLIAWLLPAIHETPPPAALAGGGLILLGILLGMGRK